MQPLSAFPISARRRIRGIFVDIDDTLTTRGRLVATAFSALERLLDAGLIVAPVTGRPAGWCDHIARTWPVDAVVGENGAFYFRYDRRERKMYKRFLLSDSERNENRERLARLGETILNEVPGTALASDQSYRESDLAIDYCEDVPPLPPEDVERVVALFHGAGATAKVSSVHVNGWFGTYDKLSMTRLMTRECLNSGLDTEKERFIFVGDSPNDVDMFAYFPNAVGVANVRDFLPLASEPRYVTERRCGEGFAELADTLLSVR